MLGFAASKLLGFLPFGNLLKGTTGKLILIGALIIGAVFMYWKWKDDIETAVYNELFREQVEEAMNEQRQEIERLKLLTEQRDAAIIQLLDRQRAITEDTDRVRETVRDESLEDGEVAPVLRETIRELRALSNPEAANEDRPDPSGNSVIDEFLRSREVQDDE